MKGIGGLCKKLEIPVFPPKWPRSGVTYYFKLFVKTFFHNFLSQPQREFNASAQNSFPKPELTGSGSVSTSPWPCLLLAPASPKIPSRWSPIQIQPPYFRTPGSPAWQIHAPLSKLFPQVDQKHFPVNKTWLICCVFRPAFRCMQHPKAGQNTQHLYTHQGEKAGPFLCGMQCAQRILATLPAPIHLLCSAHLVLHFIMFRLSKPLSIKSF